MKRLKQVEEIAFEGFVPVARDVKVVQTPFLVTGGIAKYLGRVYQEVVKRDFGGNGTLMNGIRYKKEWDVLIHSHPLSLNVLGQIIDRINPAFRVTFYRDLKNPEIEEMVEKEMCYLNAGDAFVLRESNEFWNKRDKVIFDQLRREVDNLKTPVLVSGLSVVHNPRDKNGYGLSVVPTKDFSFTHDKKKFGKKGGWAQSDYAICGLGRFAVGLDAGIDLVNSYPFGRVVLVSRED